GRRGAASRRTAECAVLGAAGSVPELRSLSRAAARHAAAARGRRTRVRRAAAGPAACRPVPPAEPAREPAGHAPGARPDLLPEPGGDPGLAAVLGMALGCAGPAAGDADAGLQQDRRGAQRAAETVRTDGRTMSARRIGLWQRIRGSFVFVPAAALGSGVLAGFGMLALEAPLSRWLHWQPGALAGPEASRAALTAIATSSLTIAALAVSLTLAVLTYAGAQYSPRVLKTFLADAVSQVSIGLLLAVHAYCLVVLRGHANGGDAGHTAPEIATGLGVIAGFIAVALLVYYVHHLASSLRASHVVAAI